MKTKSLISGLFAMVAGATMFTSCGGNAKTGATVDLSGAGATFPEPFYTMVFDNFSDSTGNTVAYGGIGSGGGVRNLKDRTVDFAASDAFLSDEEMAEMGEPVIHIPTCMGAVVLGYNLPGVGTLNLSGDIIADIFAGKITKWNDARLAELNPDAQLPAKDIIPVFRSDGSGTTFVFTNYLSQVSSEWKEKFGAAKSVDFPAGQAAKGNPGVAGIVKETPYSIGYIGSEYAFAQKIPMATLKNAAGKLVTPTIESITAAAGSGMPADTRTMITNSSDPNAYPISCLTWIIVFKEQNYSNRTKEQALATLDLLKFILSAEVQKTAAAVNYAPLPAEAVANSLKNLKALTYDGKPLE
jgi:phosphate transport system substrate-binding protein